MRLKDTFLVPLFAGAAVGTLLGALLVGTWGYFRLSSLKGNAVRGWTETAVLSAARDIPKGQLLADVDMVERKVPEACVLNNAFRLSAPPRNARARVDLQKGDVLDQGLLTAGAP